MTDKMPLCDISAEQATLGAILIDPVSLMEVSSIVEPSDFYRPAHQLIYKAMLNINHRHGNIDIITVREEIANAGKLTEIGETKYLTLLADQVVTSANISDHAKIIRDKATQRQYLRFAMELTKKVYERDDIASWLPVQQAALAKRLAADAICHNYNEVILSAVKQIEDVSKGNITWLRLGYKNLDRLLGGGLKPAQLAIVAGRPGSGKTNLAVNIAENVAESGKRVLYFSLEMTAEELAQRTLAGFGKIDMSEPLKENDWSKIWPAAEKASKLQITVVDTPKLTIDMIRAIISKQIIESTVPIGLIIIDHIGKIKHHNPNASPYQKMCDISSDLKNLGKEFALPILTLCQLNRAVENRNVKNKRPCLADLRDSGSIEEDADIVIMIYRRDYYKHLEVEDNGDGEYQEDTNIVDLYIRKNRNGPPGQVEMFWQPGKSRFESLSRVPD